MNLRTVFDRKFRLYLLLIFLLEIFSFCGFLLPFFNKLCFIAIAVIALVLTCIKLEYGLLIAFAELFIGSKGYLFYWAGDGFAVSIRIALWLIVMSVWAARILSSLGREGKLTIPLWHSRYRYSLILLIGVLGWGTAVACLRHNEPSNIFFDLNNWLYFALALPLYTVYGQNRGFLLDLGRVFFACACWLVLKSFFLLFIFSHNLIGMIFEIYRWVRETGVGEITLVQGGFYRIFFQSHIFVIFAFFLVLVYLLERQKELRENKRYFYAILALLSAFQTVNLLSYSRGNWVGLLTGLAVIGLVFMLRRQWRELGKAAGYVLAATAAGLVLIVVITKFPYPDPTGGFSAADLLSSRATAITGEAGASSRWSLLPELWLAIKSSPLTGSGLGATVTYISSDPRVLQSSPTGEYTTYAFEWGWLDIWLKFGLIGLLAYLGIICHIVLNNCRQHHYLALAACASAIALAFIHVFSPYLNHPLGIGTILILMAVSEKYHE